MLTYHDDPDRKAHFLKRVAEHEEADRITQGSYWDGRRGCAVGCTLHDYGETPTTKRLRKLYGSELGVPTWLAALVDGVHEGLPLWAARSWPRRFLETLPVGVDLDEAELWKRLTARRLREEVVPWLDGLPPAYALWTNRILEALDRRAVHRLYSEVGAMRLALDTPDGSLVLAEGLIRLLLPSETWDLVPSDGTRLILMFSGLARGGTMGRCVAYMAETERLLSELRRPYAFMGFPLVIDQRVSREEMVVTC